MADKRISQLIERVTIANNDVLPIVASGATTTNKVTVSTLQDWMQNNLDVGVTSIGITIGSSGTDINVSGSPITTSGNITINIPTASATNRGLLSSSDWTTFNNKLSSVGLSMPSAFTVSNSPLTANGTITVTGAGTVAQYIRGDGSLADFPEAGGGGASVSYYLNGSVSQGTIGGIAYYEMNKTPILGAGTDFTIAADGYIASFITDAGDPSLIEIPGGNWNFESYFQASSGGGSPSFYIELYKVNSGGTATLIASNSANPELIAFGTTTTAYFSTLAVPTTTLALTDRLAVRFYVTHSGRTITMHTENSNLCQVITTFTTGLTALNGLTAQVQNFATGTSGTDFAISSAGSTHTFNLPDASASARGVVSTNSQVFTGVKTFSNGLSLPAVGGTNQTTRLVNIGTIHEGSAGSNQIGFNNSNNIYFGKGLSDGGVITWSNSEVRSYTLPNVSGVIALTTNIPTNPVGGSGTINQIPKYTSSTTTIGNSNISDNGSDVVISSRTGISLSGQSILITPNLGGTTNRIETTGSLPLAIATSGASITLAAGGTTPQITLASSGAVTLTGALNGTSASFDTTNAITLTASDSRIRGGDTTGRLLLANSGTTTYGIFHGSSHATLPNAIQFYNDNTLSLTLASTGAATFSSSVTAGTNIQSNNGHLILSAGSGTSYSSKLSTAYNYPYVDTYLDSLAGASYDGRINFRIQRNGGAVNSIMTLMPEGNVGIGTTSPTSKLSVDGDIRLQSSTAAAKSIVFSSPASNWGPQDSSIKFTPADGTNAATSLSFNLWDGLTNTIERMRITSTGNVGIGTTSPDIYGFGASGRYLTLQNTAGFSLMQVISNGTDGSGISFGNATIRRASIDAVNGSDLTFNTNASNSGSTMTERMRITSGGNVVINNLAVSPFFSGENSTSSSPNFQSWNKATSGDNKFVEFYTEGGTGTLRGSIDFNRGAGLVRYNTTSDANFKNIIGDSDKSKSIEILNSTKIREYSWKDDESNKPQIGVIAQELHETFKGAVSVGSDEELLGTEDYKPWAVDKTAFTFHLIAGWQEHQRIIQELKAEIEALKSQING